jgi:hypothetical protein
METLMMMALAVTGAAPSPPPITCQSKEISGLPFCDISLTFESRVAVSDSPLEVTHTHTPSLSTESPACHGLSAAPLEWIDTVLEMEMASFIVGFSPTPLPRTRTRT